MVIIFRWVTGESSFLMRLMFPAHWNFSELMKKSGCLMPGKVSSSRGNIQASSAMPHLKRQKFCSGLTYKNQIPWRGSYHKL